MADGVQSAAGALSSGAAAPSATRRACVTHVLGGEREQTQ